MTHYTAPVLLHKYLPGERGGWEEEEDEKKEGKGGTSAKLVLLATHPLFVKQERFCETGCG